MKRTDKSLLVLAASAMLASACQAEKLGPGSGEVDVTFSASIPSGLTTYAGPQAFSHLGGANNVAPEDYDLRYKLEVYDGDNMVYETVKTVASDFCTQSVDFSVRLLAKEYKFVMWADFVEEASTSDRLYNTSDLRSVTYMSGVSAQDMARDDADAYYGCVDVDLTVSGQNLSDIKLYRPFGKVRFIATDVLSEGSLQTEVPSSVTLDFKGAEVPSVFNAMTGESSGSLSVSSVNFDAVQEDAEVSGSPKPGAYLLGNVYFFAHVPSEAYGLDVTVNSTAGQIGYRELSGIPVKKNMLTTVIGNFYTNEGSIEVIVDDAFEDPEDVEHIPATINVTSLEAAQKELDLIAAESGSETIDYSIVFNITDKAALNGAESLSLPSQATDVTVVFNEGFENTVTIDVKDGNTFAGTLKIENKGEAGDIVINTPDASVVLEGAYSSVDATTADETLVISEGSVLESLTVNGGNVKIFGTVDPKNITVNSKDSRIYWGAGTAERLGEVLSYPADRNHGVILTADIAGAADSGDGSCVTLANDGYAFDGNGFAISGGAAQNIMVISGDNITVKGLEIFQTQDGAASNGITAYCAKGVTLSDVTVRDCRKAGIVVNGSEVTASSLHTSGNAWGAVNVGKGSGVTSAPVFTFDSSCSFEENNKVWVDCEKPWTVNAPEGWMPVVSGSVTYYIQMRGQGTEEDPYRIGSVEEMVLFGSLVDSGNAFQGKTIVLENNLDMSGIQWNPAGHSTNSVFSGVFDGKGNTISNLSIDNYNDNDGPGVYYAGIFYTFNGTLKNLNVENADVHGIRASVLVGRMDGGKISNCHITNATVKGVQKNGAIAGYVSGWSSDIEISDCSVKDCSFTSAYDGVYWQTGAISGYLAVSDRNVLISGNTVDGISITGTDKNDDFYYMEQLYSHPFVGNVINVSNKEDAYDKYTVEFRNNTVLNSDGNDLQTCDRTGEFFGWYAGDCNSDGYLYSQKLVVDGVVYDRFVEIERLASQIATGGNVKLFRSYDLTRWGKSLTVGAGKEAVLDLAGYSVTGRYDVIVNDGKLTVMDSKGSGKIISTAILSGKTAIMNNKGAEFVFEGGTVESKMFAFLNEGVADIRGGKLVSSSRNSYIDEETGKAAWAYCTRTQNGGQTTISNATVEGIQGGIACIEPGSRIVLNDGVKVVVKHSAPGKNDAFYALYAATLGVIEVNGGEYYSDRVPCCYASDDDITGNPYGAFVLKGGKYSSMPKNHGGSDWWAEEGYKFIETSDATYPYEVVKE